MQINFPEGFLWGAAASGPQTEGASHQGGKSPSTWDVWHEREPEAFWGQIGPQVASDVYHHYSEDAQLMQDMGMNSYRTSIQWTRLLPDGRTLNQEAVDYYRQYFQTLLDHGVEPIINLFHFDMPWWLMEEGGWENPRCVEDFAYYARTAFESFGDLIDQWATFNEPMVHIECGYLGEHHWPRVNDPKRAIQVAYHTLMAHFAAVREFRQGDFPGSIGTILNLSPVYPKSQAEEDLAARDWADLINIRSLLDPIVHGHFPTELLDMFREHGLLPDTYPGAQDLMKESIDFLGVNYYQPLRVQAQDDPRSIEEQGRGYFYQGYVWPDRVMNPYRGWEIYPRGIYDIACRIRDDYQNLPWFISENGMGVEDEERFMDEEGVVQDTYRIDFIRDHLVWLHRAIQAGSQCMGYHLWTFVDCWSWLNSYKNRYGYISLDLKTQARTPKLSSHWMAQVIKDNSLEVEEDPN